MFRSSDSTQAVVINTTHDYWIRRTSGRCEVKIICRFFEIKEENVFQVKTYKVTHWLKERDKILLGPKENLRNVSVEVPLYSLFQNLKIFILFR